MKATTIFFILLISFSLTLASVPAEAKNYQQQELLDYAKARRADSQKMVERAKELSLKMGINFNPQKWSVRTTGGVPVVINGNKVPLNLLTEKERSVVQLIRDYFSLLKQANK